MKIRFWGVRGSIASPGPKTARYGGNTTCIEVRTDNNELIIIDAGTGIFPLSQALLAELPVTANVLITHSHWDHIQGLPFFIPNFIPGNLLRLHGAFDPVSGKGVEQVMSVQLQYSYFPVREAEMKARIEYVTLMPEVPVQIGSATVTPYLLNHPVINFGYRIDCAGKSVFFTGDHEPPYNIYGPDDEEFAEYQRFVDDRAEGILRGMQGVDVLIADCSYTEQEYAAKRAGGMARSIPAFNTRGMPGPASCFAPTTSPPAATMHSRKRSNTRWRPIRTSRVTPTSAWPAKAKPSSFSQHRG